MEEEPNAEASSARDTRVREADEEQLALFREYLRYENGELYWIKRPGPAAKLDEPIGCFDSYGYLVFKFKGVMYKVHRVVFFLHHEYWPETVDHRDRDKANNYVDNLRDASWMEQRWNQDDVNVSYVSHRYLSNPYRVVIRRNNQRVFDKSYPTYEEAAVAANSMKNELGEVNV